MCLAIPGKVVETYREHEILMGKIDFDGIQRRVCLECVADIQVGDYALVHAGIAISRIDEIEARRIFELLEEMGELEEIRNPNIEIRNNFE